MRDYYDALCEKEWKERRKEILERDNYRCSLCGRTRTIQGECSEKPGDSPKICYVGLNYSENVAIHNDIVVYENKKIVLKGWCKSRIFENGLRHVLMGGNYLVPTTMKNLEDLRENLSSDSVMYGLANCGDGSLYPVMFQKGENPSAPFETDIIVRPYLSNHPVELHVHHKYYILEHEPWEYPDNALVTLCGDCHNKLHTSKIVDIPVYAIGNNGTKIKMDYTPCKRCAGQGYLTQYLHIDGGICFRCKGAKYEELIPDKDEVSDYNDL